MRPPYTVILASGDFPTAAQPLAFLQGAAQIICCDSAVAPLVAYGLAPTAIVGDLDSLPAELKSKFRARIFPEAEQETNDLCKAFRFCIRHNWKRLAFLGLTGKREDHTLGNLFHLFDFATQETEIEAVTDFGIFNVIEKEGKLTTHIGQPVSLFPQNFPAHITATGLKWPLKGQSLTAPWQATLNEAVQTEIYLRADCPLLVYRAYAR